MSQRTEERIPREHRMRSPSDFARLKARGQAHRGLHCLIVVDDSPGERTRVGFVASRRGVGNAVQRNRAKRRLREIVRRRWPSLDHEGTLVMLVAFRSALVAPHADLVQDVERLLARAGLWTRESDR